jgi:hypothetical protein
MEIELEILYVVDSESELWKYYVFFLYFEFSASMGYSTHCLYESM